MADDGWITVGKRNKASELFGTEEQADNGSLHSEDAETIETLVTVAEGAEDPLQAIQEASWFSVLSRSDISLDEFRKVLDMIDIVLSRCESSDDRERFLLETLEHEEVKTAFTRILEMDTYEEEHLGLIHRYSELVRVNLDRSNVLKFEGIARALYRLFSKRERSLAHDDLYEIALGSVNELLAHYQVEEFEDRFIDGYPSGSSAPDNFRLIPSYPRAEDVDGDLPFLRPNIETGPFKSLGDYLDIHFRLLREEYMSALRNGIQDLRQGRPSDDLLSFNAKRVRNNEIPDEFGTITFKVDSNVDKMWEFKTGALVALPRDGLSGFIYLTCLDVFDDGHVKLEFCNSRDNLSLRSSAHHRLLVLKSAYYEAFRHTLDALKTLVELPFQLEIIEGAEDFCEPQHWQSVCPYTFGKEHREIMNDCQFQAFRQILDRKICLIQGPPGTGKTYVGLRIVESILEHGVTDTPVFVVCYTNHALDQFLEGMLGFTQSIVRIGGRSKSYKLAPYSFENLKTKVEHKTWLSADEMAEKKKCDERIKQNREKLTDAEKLLGIIDGRILFRKEEVAKLSGEFAIISDLAQFLEVSTLCQEATAKKHNMGNNSDQLNDPIEAYITARMHGAEAAEKVIAERMRKIRPLNRSAFRKVSEKIMHDCGRGEKPRHPLTLNEKWRFYATVHWKKITTDHRFGLNNDDLADSSKFEQKRSQIRRRLAESHERLSKQLAEDTKFVNGLRAKRAADMLRSKSIIGLTTTGAAKRRELLQELKCQIVVVEEAAEILESHLVAILPWNIEQLILIGDHKQLPPCINNYTLEKSFNFGLSLFERLINNKMHYVTLNVQHRMRSSFLKLLVPHIYRNVRSSPEMFELEGIRGMSKDLQFLSHKCEEQDAGLKSASKWNGYEAKMICALLDHLTHQGYTTRQIVVLCAYKGQQAHVSDLLKRTNSGKVIRVSTIDDYQGEESDIAIVSFVRCNQENEIGFLAKPNRVCVALSRARSGLFCLGDFEAYAERSNVWRGIMSTLQDMGCVSSFWELRCSSHGALVRVETPEQFKEKMPGGCCTRRCNTFLECGHRCLSLCHLGLHPVCRQPCLYIHPYCEHPCRKLCHEEHVYCEEIVPKLLVCGHEGQGPCFSSGFQIQCPQRCQKELQCGHQCSSLCGMPCTQSCMIKVPITRECGHDAAVACGAKEEERTQKSCETDVEADLYCGHHVRVQCRRTLDIVSLTSNCMRRVKNVALPCGHVQSLRCRDFQRLEQFSCKNLVEVTLGCGHSCKMQCCLSTDQSLITEKTLKCKISVEVTAACGHEVKVLCKSASDAAQYCLEPVDVELGCGHTRTTTCGTTRNQNRLRKMMEACEEKVLVAAPCRHPVEVSCGARHDARLLLTLCRYLVEVNPGCGHKVRVVCSASRNFGFVRKLCQVGRTLSLTCRHTIHVPCSDSRTLKEASNDCNEIVLNTLRCNHKVEQVCSGTLGNLRIECQQACEFVHRCGHICTGNCATCRGGQLHQTCRSDCSLALPCGHPCKGKCGRRCGPCDAPCKRQCAHGRCEKKCGEPCASKGQTCRRRGVDHCPHQSCAAKTCWECECEPCEQKCNKKLDKCDHQCEGTCGEPCVECFRCKPKRLKALFGETTVSGRFLRVPGCDHIVDAEIMDRVMASWSTGTPRCINCDTTIPVWRRYNNVYNRIHRRSSFDEEKSREVERARQELLEKTRSFKSELASIELREDSADREMARHFAGQIITDLRSRLKQSKSEDVELCETVFWLLTSLVEVHEEVLRVGKGPIGGKPVRKRISVVAQDVFEDLSVMADMKPVSESLWTLSVLDDISTQALRLKLFTMLPRVSKKIRSQVSDLIFAGGRFSLTDANALLKSAHPELTLEPFYEN